MKQHTVSALSRSTVSVNSEIGTGDSESYDVSVMVESVDGLGIVVERPMYFSYQGTGGWGWTGGHDVIGLTEAGEVWEQEGGKRVSDPYFFDVCVIELDGGMYRMYGEKSANIESYVSNDGLNWEKEAGVRVADAAFPLVTLLPNGKFRMFYVPAGAGGTQDRILSALSDDGLNFTPEAGVRYAASGPYEERVQSPRIVALPDGSYRMYYTGISGTGNNELVVILSAKSPDGSNFQPEAGIRVDPRVSPLMGGRAAHAWPLWNEDGTLRLYFAGLLSEQGPGILAADSSDGLNFAVNLYRAVTAPDGDLTPQDPCVLAFPEGLRMYYGLYRGPEVTDASAIYSAIKRR